MRIARQTLALHVVCILALLMLVGCNSEPDKVFNGKDLKGWRLRGDPNDGHWSVGIATVLSAAPRVLTTSEGRDCLINVGLHHNYSRDLFTTTRFGDCRVELEFLIPAGANSGVYLMGKYEIQIGDSFDDDQLSTFSTSGAILGVAEPNENAALPSGQWQSLVVDFRAPRFNSSGNKTANARFIKVLLNDKLIHQNVDVSGPTGNVKDVLKWKEEPTGPLMLQGNHGSAAFRNIFVRPLSVDNP